MTEEEKVHYITTWHPGNTVLKELMAKGEYLHAIDYFRKLRDNGPTPNSETCVMGMQTLKKLGDKDSIYDIWKFMMKDKVIPDSRCWDYALESVADMRDKEKVLEVYNLYRLQIKELGPDNVVTPESLYSAIRALCQVGELEEADNVMTLFFDFQMQDSHYYHIAQFIYYAFRKNHDKVMSILDNIARERILPIYITYEFFRMGVQYFSSLGSESHLVLKFLNFCYSPGTPFNIDQDIEDYPEMLDDKIISERNRYESLMLVVDSKLMEDMELKLSDEDIQFIKEYESENGKNFREKLQEQRKKFEQEDEIPNESENAEDGAEEDTRDFDKISFTGENHVIVWMSFPEIQTALREAYMSSDDSVLLGIISAPNSDYSDKAEADLKLSYKDRYPDGVWGDITANEFFINDNHEFNEEPTTAQSDNYFIEKMDELEDNMLKEKKEYEEDIENWLKEQRENDVPPDEAMFDDEPMEGVSQEMKDQRDFMRSLYVLEHFGRKIKGYVPFGKYLDEFDKDFNKAKDAYFKNMMSIRPSTEVTQEDFDNIDERDLQNFAGVVNSLQLSDFASDPEIAETLIKNPNTKIPALDEVDGTNIMELMMKHIPKETAHNLKDRMPEELRRHIEVAGEKTMKEEDVTEEQRKATREHISGKLLVETFGDDAASNPDVVNEVIDDMDVDEETRELYRKEAEREGIDRLRQDFFTNFLSKTARPTKNGMEGKMAEIFGNGDEKYDDEIYNVLKLDELATLKEKADAIKKKDIVNGETNLGTRMIKYANDMKENPPKVKKQTVPDSLNPSESIIGINKMQKLEKKIIENGGENYADMANEVYSDSPELMKDMLKRSEEIGSNPETSEVFDALREASFNSEVDPYDAIHKMSEMDYNILMENYKLEEIEREFGPEIGRWRQGEQELIEDIPEDIKELLADTEVDKFIETGTVSKELMNDAEKYNKEELQELAKTENGYKMLMASLGKDTSAFSFKTEEDHEKSFREAMGGSIKNTHLELDSETKYKNLVNAINEQTDPDRVNIRDEIFKNLEIDDMAEQMQEIERAIDINDDLTPQEKLKKKYEIRQELEKTMFPTKIETKPVSENYAKVLHKLQERFYKSGSDIDENQWDKHPDMPETWGKVKNQKNEYHVPFSKSELEDPEINSIRENYETPYPTNEQILKHHLDEDFYREEHNDEHTLLHMSGEVTGKLRRISEEYGKDVFDINDQYAKENKLLKDIEFEVPGLAQNQYTVNNKKVGYEVGEKNPTYFQPDENAAQEEEYKRKLAEDDEKDYNQNIIDLFRTGNNIFMDMKDVLNTPIENEKHTISFNPNLGLEEISGILTVPPKIRTSIRRSLRALSQYSPLQIPGLGEDLKSMDEKELILHIQKSDEILNHNIQQKLERFVKECRGSFLDTSPTISIIEAIKQTFKTSLGKIGQKGVDDSKLNYEMLRVLQSPNIDREDRDRFENRLKNIYEDLKTGMKHNSRLLIILFRRMQYDALQYDSVYDNISNPFSDDIVKWSLDQEGAFEKLFQPLQAAQQSLPGSGWINDWQQFTSTPVNMMHKDMQPVYIKAVARAKQIEQELEKIGFYDQYKFKARRVWSDASEQSFGAFPAFQPKDINFKPDPFKAKMMTEEMIQEFELTHEASDLVDFKDFSNVSGYFTSYSKHRTEHIKEEPGKLFA
eukprot:TRINITY_DN6235_c0_g1_i1.p1 TRINITY_DN6235_c0_g1~~TRINITY_DN6235_c0_g1_i1.p1  ORF type:complete len:1747 (+),score=537.48 TRINITY_DN6235_c0_g1_i1:240-5243(+)